MFYKQERSILALIFGNNSLMKQRLVSLSKDINDLKESLEFSQNECDDKFMNMDHKVQKLEEEINRMKQELLVIIQTTKPLWVIETDIKFVDFNDHFRRNNSRFERIKEHENESWEDCENKMLDLLENKLEMDIKNFAIEREHQTRKKNKKKSRPIVAQFSFY